MTDIAEVISELVDANHVLVDRGVLDAYGHVSARHPDDPSKFLIARNLAPGLVGADDIQVVDLDGNTEDTRSSYLERFIHGEIYRRRPDVRSVVHSHSPSVVPFSISSRPLQAVWHMAGFLGGSVPIYDIREDAGSGSDLLIRSSALGAGLARALGEAAVALMRGHGSVAVGNSVPHAVWRAVFTELNARALAVAASLGEVTPLTPEEAVASADSNYGQIRRPWELWRQEARARR